MFINKNNFRCISVSPISLSHPAIAIATARAGGIGLLDCEFPGDAVHAESILEVFLAAVAPHHEIGLRLRTEQISSVGNLLLRLGNRPHWLVLCDGDSESIDSAIRSLPVCGSRRVLVEVISAESAAQVPGMLVAGLIARGHEAGGWGGEDSTFVLVQKLLALKQYPVYAQGGIGIHTAAACRAVGAEGVVLDDQLLLMAESPLPSHWRRHLDNLSGQEAIAFGEQIACPCRVLTRPGFKVISVLQELANTAEMQGWSPAEWRSHVDTHVGWEEPGERAWPVGQAIGLAAPLRDRYKTTGRLIRALLDHAEQVVQCAQTLKPLAPGSALAESHGTRYPIVQGPMTRVSDKPEFADAVSRAGGLPMLALALMRGEQARELLIITKQLLKDRPWGVGILGFVPQQLREEQIRAINEVKPPFALIAGGRPDQAARFEDAGIATYIHAPVPQLLKMFLEQGARRFVFEGRECGGHVGPLSSFVLWEQMINVLLHDLPSGAERDVHVLFAGGIHDARSAAMVATLAAPLSKRGMRVGVLMGTAYLFTAEIIDSGAVVKGFQEQAVLCQHTVNLETGPGHASRCSVTPFAHEFHATRRRMLAAGESAEAIKDTLEDLNLGRLRIASKGLVRKGGEGISTVNNATQFQEGMYMIGQVATMRDRVVGIEELHSEVSQASAVLLDQAQATAKAARGSAEPSDIAVIGIGTLLPGARDSQQYWRNIIDKVNVISEIPAHRWDWRLYFDTNRQTRDKIYSRWGGFLDEVPFDPVRYGIPPNSLKSIDPMQLLALEAVRRALDDSGYADGNFDRENTSVILGAGGGLGDLGQQYAVRAEIPHYIEAPSDKVWDRLPEWTEESFPGALLNVVAGRVANRFDFGGTNYTVDAACASSLAAIKLAADELESGRSNLVIAGGVDTVQNPFGYLCFSKTQALSPKGVARTFDKQGDGIVISEGVATVVLKRLADAERDGDRIYAVIKAVGSSSDGKALGLTAPLPEGQMRALRRAYDKAGFGPDTVGLIEAHGTGTVVGDNAEIQTVIRTLRASNTPAKSCVIGSVKTMIGHTKATAGVAGLIKVALALHHKVLPPHMGVESPIDPIADNSSPVYLLKEARPWMVHPDYPRRAGVSAFGFGGTNFHAVLEEYGNEYREATAPSGAGVWSSELLVFRNSSRAALIEDLLALQQALQAGAEPRLLDLAYTCMRRFESATASGVSVALVVESLTQLDESLGLLVAQLQGNRQQALPPLVIHEDLDESRPSEKVAFLFPGQGAQYPDMARESALYLPEIRTAVEFADRQLRQHFPRVLSDFIFPPTAYSDNDAEAQRQRLTNTHIAQPAIGAISSGFLDLAQRLGLKPDMVAGHSYGEFAALYAAGVMSRQDFLMLSETRGRVMAGAQGSGDSGTMAAVQLAREDLATWMERYPDIVIANHNAPLQSVISGPTEAVEQAVRDLNASDITARMLPVSGAYHSRLVAAAQAPLADVINQVEFASASLPVYGNSTAAPYPGELATIREQLAGHLLSPVEFVGQINAMYEAGARTFIELGPKSILTNLVGQILEGREHLAVALDGQGGGLRGLLTGLGRLAVRGVNFDLAALFEGRNAQALDLTRLVETTKPALMSPTTWLVNGGCARRPSEPQGRTGKLPALTDETARTAHREVAARLAKATGTGDNSEMRQAPIQTASVPVAAVSPAAPAQLAAALNPGLSTEALLSYQETMRQFLALQEQVVSQFLAGSAAVPVAQVNISQPVSPPAAQVTVASVAPPPAVAAPVAKRASAPPSPLLPPTAPAIAAVPARGELVGLLLELVSERTGYPTDMLGLDQDLEAELGIDSIKRVEIVGALQKRLPAALAERMQAKMEQLTRAKSLNALIDQLLEGAGAAAAASSVVPTGHAVAAVPARGELVGLLLELVSERTGYPTDMLGLDQDLEAELGIDSIKRVEIVGALQKRLPAALAERMQAKMEQLTRAKSLNALIDQLLEGISAPVLQSDAPGKPAAKPTPAERPATPEPVPRFVIEGRAEPLPAPSDSVTGLFLITADAMGVAPLVAAELAKQGVIPAIIDPDALLDSSALDERICELRHRHGLVAGILHLVTLGPDVAPVSLTEWRRYSQLHTKSLFHLMKLCGSDLQQLGNGRVLITSQLGGCYGRNGLASGGLATAGGGIGLLKTMVQEWSGVTGRSLDFDTTLSPADMAGVIVNELLARIGNLEVGYPKGQRTVFYTVPAPLHTLSAAPQLLPGEEWVTLVTAGARGITAEIASEFARPGMKFVIVGRTPEPQTESPDTADIGDVASLRKHLLERARSSGATPTPMMIEEQLSKLLRDREIRDNLAHFAAAGADVTYQAVDVRNAEEFGALIDGIYDQFGRLDAVLHGAGIIDDKLIIDKTEESFNRVFDTKVDSGFLLSKHLRPETLKVVLFFTSVAGRYGNHGQGDYAAANEVVNRLAWQLDQQWKDTRVMAINWGPWDTTGMASEGVKRQFRERGIIPIPVQSGRRFFLDELRFGQKGSVELVAGQGPWGQEHGAEPAKEHGGSEFPLLLSQPTMEPNGTISMEHRFTLANDPYLTDHRLDNNPVLPVAGAAEWIAEFVQAAWSDWVVCEVRDLTVLRGLKFNADGVRRVVFVARASSHADFDSLQVSAEILDAESRLPYYKASVILRPELKDSPLVNIAPLTSGQGTDVDHAYRDYLFHGPYFQLIKTIDTLDVDGVDATIGVSEPRVWLKGRGGSSAMPWLFDPGILDVAPQLAIVWSRLQRGTTALPSRFGSVVRYGKGALRGPLRLMLRITPNDNDHLLTYDAVIVDADGKVRISVQNVESACNAALNRLAASP